MSKRLAVLALMMILLVCLPVWALAANLTIADGETATLSGTLSEGCNIQVDGQATLVLDHVNMTANQYAALKIDGTGSLNIIYKGTNMLRNPHYGIFSECDEVTLTPGSVDALLRIDCQFDSGFDVKTLHLAEGAKVDVNSSAGSGLYASGLHVGANAVLNATGGWHGIDLVGDATISKNALVNAHGSFDGLWVRFSNVVVEAGAEVNLSSDGATHAAGSPLDIIGGCFLIKSGARVNAKTDVTFAAIMVDGGSLIVEEGATLNGVSNRYNGMGLMTNEASSIQLNSENVTFSGGTKGAICKWHMGYVGEPGTLQLGPQLIAQHRNAAEEPWEEMTGKTTQNVTSARRKLRRCLSLK